MNEHCGNFLIKNKFKSMTGLVTGSYDNMALMSSSLF